jgi:hypothetical protein
MAIRARKLAEENYDWETVSGKMEMLMQNAVQASARDRNEQEFATA